MKLLAEGGTISVQVLNEFAETSRRKLKLDMPKILESLTMLKDKFDVVSLTVAVQARAMEIAATTNFGIYDSNIIAAAELAGCDVLYTEDLNHGQRIGNVAIVNPFM